MFVCCPAATSDFPIKQAFDGKGKLTCIDNISAHGTFVDGHQLKQVNWLTAQKRKSPFQPPAFLFVLLGSR
jgi:hypothetical protein